MRKIITLESVTEKIFSFPVDIHFFCGVYRHNILDEIKITERYTRLKRVHGNTPVGTENIIHIQFSDAFLRFFLKFFG